MVTYPTSLPCPMIEGYSIDVDMGVLRSKERGFPQQRRNFTTMPHVIKCKFSLSLKQWGYWQEFFSREALGWFWLDLPSMYAGLKNVRTVPHLVRLTDVVTIDTRSSTHITASVTLELAPSTIKKYLEAV